MPREALIERRIRAGLEKARARGVRVRAIYLNPADQATLDRLATRRWGSGAKVYRCDFDNHPIINDRVEFDGHPIRPGKRTMIYDHHGVGIAIPVRLKTTTAP